MATSSVRGHSPYYWLTQGFLWGLTRGIALDLYEPLSEDMEQAVQEYWESAGLEDEDVTRVVGNSDKWDHYFARRRALKLHSTQRSERRRSLRLVPKEPAS